MQNLLVVRIVNVREDAEELAIDVLHGRREGLVEDLV